MPFKRNVRWWLTGLAISCVLFWWLIQPLTLDSLNLADESVNLVNGEHMFYAGGCAACHASTSDGNQPLLLTGGQALKTRFGVFYAPNISTNPENGIGNWSTLEFINAMRYGVSPQGQHYYPSFPYTSYTRMSTRDLVDLKAYLDTLPADSSQSLQHDLKFPYNHRWLLGPWKRLLLDPSPVLELDREDAELERGRYLVEGPGHCGECHTPRNMFGAMDLNAWLSGGPSPEGKGRIPDITSGPDGLGDWSKADISYFLETGIDAEFDVVGGSMVEVQENISRLSEADRNAIATYLKSVNSKP